MEHLHVYLSVKTAWTFSFKKKRFYYLFVFLLYICLIYKQMLSSRKVEIHSNYNNNNKKICIQLHILRSTIQSFFCLVWATCYLNYMLLGTRPAYWATFVKIYLVSLTNHCITKLIKNSCMSFLFLFRSPLLFWNICVYDVEHWGYYSRSSVTETVQEFLMVL